MDGSVLGLPPFVRPVRKACAACRWSAGTSGGLYGEESLVDLHVKASVALLVSLSLGECAKPVDMKPRLSGHVPDSTHTFGKWVMCHIVTIRCLTRSRGFLESRAYPASCGMQVYCSVLCSGPGRVSFNGCFKNRGNCSYQRDLGAAIIKVASAVPHGMLIFFPSYASMKAIMDEWQAWPVGGDSLWRQLELQKPIFQEPRSAGEFQRVCQLAC
jgi:hypothetical protein